MKIYTDVLPQEVLNECCERLRIMTTQGVWRTSTFNWGDSIAATSCGEVAIVEIPKDLTIKLNDALYEKYFLFYEQETEIVYHFQIWNKLSNISMHDDITYTFSATIYLNDIWEIDWGGIFIWKDKEENQDYALKALCPKRNMLVINDNLELHTVTSISPYTPSHRFSIQIWAKKSMYS